VDQDRIGAGLAVGFAALDGLCQAPACDKGLHPGDDAEIIIGLSVFAGLDLAAKSLDILQLLLLTLATMQKSSSV
jgi:hypothetical protein